MSDRLNATQGSLLGLLHDQPKTGWDLLQEVQAGLVRFWNVTPSHLYRELHTLEERGLIAGQQRGVRDRRPFSITAAGKRAFKSWMTEGPGPEQLRFPLLVKLWFGQHVDRRSLAGFIEASRKEHEERLELYEHIEVHDPHAASVVAFGVAYETAVLGWLSELPGRLQLAVPT